MNILITGGTGLIGQALCKALLRQHQLTVVSRDIKRASAILDPEIRIIASLNVLTELNDIDAVINLAGEPIADKRWSHQQKDLICQSRWQTTQHLVKLFNASSNPPAVFISGSAIGIYGQQNAQPISEEFTQFHPEFSHTICEQWEAIANQVEAITRVCLLRTGIVLSREGGALKKMLPAFKFGAGGRLGTGKQYMSWIHIDDMISGIIWLLTHPNLSGAFNFTAPKAVTNKEFTRHLAHTLHRPIFFPMPAPVLKLLFGEMSTLLLTGQNIVPSRLTASGFEFRYTELPAALNALVGNK